MVETSNGQTMYLFVIIGAIFLIQMRTTSCNTTESITSTESDVMELTTGGINATQNLPSTSSFITTEATVITATEVGGQCDLNILCAVNNTICRNFVCQCRNATYKFDNETCLKVSIPDAPKRVTVSVSQRQIKLMVDRPDEVNGGTLKYDVEVYTKRYADEEFKFHNRTVATAGSDNYTSVTVSLDPGVYFNVSVYSRNELFRSANFVHVDGQTAEEKPGSVTFKGNTTNTTSAQILFNRPRFPNGKILGYSYLLNSTKDYRKGRCDSNGTTQYQCHPDVYLERRSEDLTLSFHRLSPYTWYYLKLSAFNGIGEGIANEIKVMTAVSIPIRPFGRFSHITSTSVNISWTDGPLQGPTSFKAFVISSPSSSCTIHDNVMQRFCTITNLEPYTSYSVVITATTSAGSVNSSVLAFRTLPGDPHELEHQTISHLSSTSVTIIWKYGKPTGITTFDVIVYDEQDKKRLTNPACINVRYRDMSQTCTFDGLEEYWEYSYTITVKVVRAGTRRSNKKVFTTLATVPGSPQNVRMQIAGNDCPSKLYYLYWEEPGRRDRNGCIDKYVIKYMETTVVKKVNCHNPYSHINRTYSMALASVPGQTLYISIYSVLKNEDKHSVSKSIQTNRPGCGLSSLAIALIVISLLIGILAGILCFVLSSRWKRRGNSVPIQTLSTSLMRRTFSKKRLRRNRPINMESFPAYVDKMKKNSNHGFALEFTDLNELSVRKSAVVALSAENKLYNRYDDIYPFDESRVQLSSHYLNYINASYIPGYTFGREYIAAQGPLPRTITDFWVMIWENDVSVIVMLTRCQEGTVTKCERYWPKELNQPETYGELEVTVESVPSATDLRVISELRLKKGDIVKKATHFHFLKWPDHSASFDPCILLNFVYEVRRHVDSDAGPMTVHCSAGVGRSGTFIAVDYFTKVIRAHDLSSEVDIFEFILKMREHRVRMVQTEEQYRFVYEAVREMIRQKQNGSGLESGTSKIVPHIDNSLEEDEEEEVEEELEEEELDVEVIDEGELKIHEEDRLKESQTESDEDEEGSEDENTSLTEDTRMKNINSFELQDENQIGLYVRSTANVIYGREKLRKKEKPADDIPILQNEHQTTEL